MEVTTGDHFAGVGEYQRIVGDCVGFGQQHVGGVLHDIAHRAHDLRLTPKAVRVLHASVVAEVRLANGTAGQQSLVVSGHRYLAGLATHGMDTRIERGIGAARRIHAHRAR